MLHRLLLLALLGVASGLKVAVTGAGGKTGSLLFKRLIDDPATFDPLAVVRSRKSSTKKLRKATGVSVATLEPKLFEADMTEGADALATLLKSEQVDALCIATSAVPKIRIWSIIKLLLSKIIRRKGGRPSFYFRERGTPEEVDWLGQKAQIDAAKQAGVNHIVLCSSMGGTQVDNFLNTIGLKEDGTGGQILMWKRKAEEYLIASGITYTILHPGGLLDKPGGRKVLFGIDDKFLELKTRSIPRTDVAEVMAQSLLLPAARNRAIDLIAPEEETRDDGWDWETAFASTGNCNYEISPGEPKAALGKSA